MPERTRAALQHVRHDITDEVDRLDSVTSNGQLYSMVIRQAEVLLMLIDVIDSMVEEDE